MNDKITLARDVLDQHFGIYRDNVSRCATCDTVTWPCPPARLASLVLDEELAK